jgi:hypothetical protein
MADDYYIIFLVWALASLVNFVLGALKSDTSIEYVTAKRWLLLVYLFWLGPVILLPLSLLGLRLLLKGFFRTLKEAEVIPQISLPSFSRKQSETKPEAGQLSLKKPERVSK